MNDERWIQQFADYQDFVFCNLDYGNGAGVSDYRWNYLERIAGVCAKGCTHWRVDLQSEGAVDEINNELH